MQVIVNGLLTKYQRSGKGDKTVLLLHGWGDRAAGLAGLQNALAKSFIVIAPDLPGFGGTQSPPHAWGLNDYADFMSGFLKKIEAGNIYCLIGHSSGGALALRAVASGRLNAQKLVLLASAGIRGEYKGRIKALRYATKIGKTLSSPLPKAAKTSLRRKVYQTVGSDLLVAEHLQETFKKIVTDDVRSDAAQITVPTLLLYGENDDQTPVRYAELFHELIPGSTLEVLPGSGHFLQTERPETVNKAVMEFLK